MAEIEDGSLRAEQLTPYHQKTPAAEAFDLMFAMFPYMKGGELYDQININDSEEAQELSDFLAFVQGGGETGDQARDRLFGNEGAIVTPAYFHISLCYCNDAIESRADNNLSWAYVAEARFWFGFAIQAREMVLAIEEFHKLPMNEETEISDLARKVAISDLARKAAKARHAEHHDMRDEVIQHYIANKHKYKSKDAAAEAIAHKIVPLSFRAVRRHLDNL